MALTHQLAQRGTPVREFFETYFPREHFKPISKRWYETVRAVPIACVPPDGVNPGTIGTAFDYRLRLCWSPIDWKTTIAAGGAAIFSGAGRTDLGRLAFELEEELARVAPTRCLGDLEAAAEERVARCCYALALYEQCFRTAAAIASSPLLELGGRSTIEDMLALAPRAAADDLSAMARLFCASHTGLLSRPAILNPFFDGSAEVGGADADLIVERMLLELKTTRNDSFERVDHVYQLLGYALLDFSNHYELAGLGVYLARRGLLLRWEIAELLAECCSTSDWGEVQEAFRGAVRAVASG